MNTTAPLLALSILWSHTKEKRWQEVLEDGANRVLHDLPRTPEMGFQHIVSDRVNEGWRIVG